MCSTFDVIVLGAGHAGVEAALAAARMGSETLCLTMNLDSVALMACNPAIGGTSKGHLVHEVDALGGEMGLGADECFIQMRMLNTGKGPAVHSLRAQMDKRKYHERMKVAMENEPKLTLLQGECGRILTHGGKVTGIECVDGSKFSCRALVVACGVYLKSRILIGNYMKESGPCGMFGANSLSASLAELGFTLRRFKTGTPPRIDGNTVDFSRMSVQDGDEPIPHFSFLNETPVKKQVPCYLTYTNQATHDIIKENIHKSAMYSGLISGTGTRYCPSIEDKIVRFADKDRHQVFIEPEGLTTREMYVQGMSTSLPADVQRKMLRTIEGLEKCVVMRDGYAIEYDCIDPLALKPTYGARNICGLYTAGQINGSSGYEEAAAQGLLAGINAALYVQDKPEFTLSRSEAYIGVLADDLTGKGTNEPYRMMTSRAEYRLLLRQDNADIRLTEKAFRTGLISEKRYDRLCRKKDEIEAARKALEKYAPPSTELNSIMEKNGIAAVSSGIKLTDCLKRGISYTALLSLFELPEISGEAMQQVEISARYDGYIKKQESQRERSEETEKTLLPDGMDYMNMHGLRIEARQKLTALRPLNIGAASRISGVSPADIAVLLVAVRQYEKRDSK